MTKNGIDYRISLVTTEYSAFFPIFQKMVDSLIIETSNPKPGITTFNDTEERLSFQHPVNWTVEPKQNRFDEIEARIQGPPFTVSSSSAVVVNMGDKEM